jgi:hypothetical protein
MRTKTLLLAAALSAAGLATSLAQSNVYSLNVVGYVNVPTPTDNGLYLLAPGQLDFDGTGTNNTVLTTFGTNQAGVQYPTGTALYGWNQANGSYILCPYVANSGWAGLGIPGSGISVVTANGLQNGQGVFYKKAPGGPTNITFVGNVRIGCCTVPLPPANVVGLVSSCVPQAGKVENDLGLIAPGPAAPPFVQVLRYNAGYQQFQKNAGGWLGAGTSDQNQPSVNVMESFFFRPEGGASWTRCFVIP